jgi:hypothetical protein
MINIVIKINILDFRPTFCYRCLSYVVDLVFDNEHMKSLMQFKVPSHTCNPEELKDTMYDDIYFEQEKQLYEKLTSFLILVVSSAFGQREIIYLKS